jgi:hypothetical protein
MRLPRFSLRDLFWLVLVCAMGCAWWMESAYWKSQADLWSQSALRWKQNAREYQAAWHDDQALHEIAVESQNRQIEDLRNQLVKAKSE